MRVWYLAPGVRAIGKRLLDEVTTAIERLGDFQQRGWALPEVGLHVLREIIPPPLPFVERLDTA